MILSTLKKGKHFEGDGIHCCSANGEKAFHLGLFEKFLTNTKFRRALSNVHQNKDECIFNTSIPLMGIYVTSELTIFTKTLPRIINTYSYQLQHC